MLSLTKHEQAWWVGLRSTFYRTAMIVGSGLLVVLAGVLESKNGLPPVEIPVRASAKAPRVSSWDPAVIKPAAPAADLRVLAQPNPLEVALTDRSAEEAKAIINQAKAWNRQHGFIAEDKSTPVKREAESVSWWTANVSGPFGRFLVKQFPKPAKSNASAASVAGNVGVVYLSLSKEPAPGQEIAINFGRKPSGIECIGFGKSDKGFGLKEGDRFVFSSTNWNRPAMAVIQLDPKLKSDAAVTFVTSSGNIPLAWSITLFVVAGFFLAFSCWHSVMLPRPANDGPVKTHHSFAGEFFATLASFFQKPGVVMGMLFILLYRIGEAQLVKVISPFLLDSRDAGGLGLTTSEVGLAYGTFGILALTCGGLLGGFAAAKYGLKRMLPIMVAGMYLSKVAFVFLAYTQPGNFLVTCGAVAAEQFGYGFGFTAFMLYMLLFSDGPHKTAHYAICTGFMALGMMIPGMWSGWGVDMVSYKHFFVWIIYSALPGSAIALLLNRRIDPQFGKKTEH
jgi:PAT family beta-lactamase induction signal transducer AmpG